MTTENPFLKMAAQQAGFVDQDGEPLPDVPANRFELAATNTDDVEVIRNHADKMKAQASSFVVADAAGFKHIADQLDKKINEDERLDSLSLGVVRNLVRTLMVSLAKNKDLATVMLPRDVRNCIIFARLTYEDGKLIDEAVTQKKAARTESVAKRGKKGLSAEQLKKAMDNFDDLFGDIA